MIWLATENGGKFVLWYLVLYYGGNLNISPNKVLRSALVLNRTTKIWSQMSVFHDYGLQIVKSILTALTLNCWMQLLYNTATSCHMGKLNCVLCHQLDCQCHSSIGDVYNYVPAVWTTIVLDNYFCKCHLTTFCIVPSPTFHLLLSPFGPKN